MGKEYFFIIDEAFELVSPIAFARREDAEKEIALYTDREPCHIVTRWLNFSKE